MSRRKAVTVTECLECGALPAYSDAAGCCAKCGNDLDAMNEGSRQVKLVEHDPAADAVVRAAVQFRAPGASIEDTEKFKRAVDRYQRRKSKRGGGR